jgi:hypothetical protein
MTAEVTQQVKRTAISVPHISHACSPPAQNTMLNPFPTQEIRKWFHALHAFRFVDYLDFALYSCTVAAFPTPAASI